MPFSLGYFKVLLHENRVHYPMDLEIIGGHITFLKKRILLLFGLSYILLHQLGLFSIPSPSP